MWKENERKAEKEEDEERTECEIGTERLRVGGGKRRVARCHAVQLLL